MPGLPLNQLRSDGKLFSSETHDGAFLPPRVLTSINVSKELKRLPLYNILACHCFNCSNIVLPSGRVSSNNQIHGGHISSQITRPVSHGSADSEHDLAAMVHDFMENGSYGSDFHDSSDGENGLNNGAKPLEMLQVSAIQQTNTFSPPMNLSNNDACYVKQSCLKFWSNCAYYLEQSFIIYMGTNNHTNYVNNQAIFYVLSHCILYHPFFILSGFEAQCHSFRERDNINSCQSLSFYQRDGFGVSQPYVRVQR